MLTVQPPPCSLDDLSPRQRTVLAYIAERYSLKEIAAIAGCSESAVNQHVRNLKSRLSARSLHELSERYRYMISTESEQSLEPDDCRKPACRFSHLNESVVLPQQERQDAAETLLFQDAATFTVDAPWERLPTLRPGALDGKSALTYRTIVMLVMTVLFFIMGILALTVGHVLTDMISG